MSSNAASGWAQGWNCGEAGHLYVNGNDACQMCGARLTITQATGTFTSTGFPDPDKVLDQMAAVQRAQEMLDAENAPPDGIRVLAEQRAAALGVEVTFARSIEDGELRWRVTVSTRRGRVSAAPGLTQEEMMGLEINGVDWKMTGWKNALRAVGLL